MPLRTAARRRVIELNLALRLEQHRGAQPAKKTWMPGIKPGTTDQKRSQVFSMRPALLNPLFAPVTSLAGVGPKQDKLFRFLLDRDETPRLVDLLLHLPASVIDRRTQPKIRDAVVGHHRDAGGHRRPPSAAAAAQFPRALSGLCQRRHRRRGADYSSAPNPVMSKSCCRLARSVTSPARCRCMTASRRSCIRTAWSTRRRFPNYPASIRSTR